LLEPPPTFPEPRWECSEAPEVLVESLAMDQGMAIRAQRDEILFFIFARVTAKFLMMYFEVSPGAAELASPPIAAQHTRE